MPRTRSEAAAPLLPMAKIRPVSAKSKKRAADAKMENLRGLPCLLVVVIGMLLLFYLFYLALKG